MVIMKLYFSNSGKIAIASTAFTLLLLIMCIIHTHEITYIFYVWNLFLAFVPLAISNTLRKQSGFTFRSVIYLLIWLLFFPNASYLITDLFHFTEREGCPKWYDLILVSSALWNGLLIAILSLLQVEEFLMKVFSYKKVQVFLLFFISLAGFGVYLGRFQRFNSWDVVSNPQRLTLYIINSLLHPYQNLTAWLFTLIFSLLFGIIFFTIKSMTLNF